MMKKPVIHSSQALTVLHQHCCARAGGLLA
jgi:hypothetical protein